MKCRLTFDSLWYNCDVKIKETFVWRKPRHWYYYLFWREFYSTSFFFSDGKNDNIKDTALWLLYSLVCLLNTLLICFMYGIYIMLFRPACEKGYNGTNCSMICPYPSFGQNCKSNCNCILKDCDHRYGCNRTKGGN